MTSSLDAVRAARNQDLYRQVNERIADLNEAFGDILAKGSEWVCECADAACSERLTMTIAEYEALRAHPNRFAVAPGHEVPQVERVTEQHERYLIVEKRGIAGDYAVRTDPRSRTDGRSAAA